MKALLLAIAAALLFAPMARAQPPIDKKTTQADLEKVLSRLGGTAKPGIAMSDLQREVQKGIAALARLRKDDVKVSTTGWLSITVNDDDQLRALRLVQFLGSKEAAPILCRFVGVQFLVGPAYADPFHEWNTEWAAADALLAIGLPAVDAILTSVSQGTFDVRQRSAARGLCVTILGEEGMTARARFLKLDKVEPVTRFVQRK